MRGLKIASLALATVLAFWSSASAQSKQLGLRLPSESELNPLGLTRAWWAHSVTSSLRDKLMYLTLDDEHLYAQSTNGAITCFDNETGRRKWAKQLGLADNPIYPLTSNTRYVFASNGSMLYCLEKSNGNQVWQMAFPGSPSVSPAVDNSRIYLGMLDGSVYAFDIKKITELESQGLMPQWSNQTLLWRYKSTTSIISPPIPFRHVVAFANEAGKIITVGSQKRELIYEYRTGAKLSAPMALSNKTLMIPSRDNIFYAISVEHGASQWQFTVGLPIHRTPVVVQDRVYVMPLRGGMYELNANTGKSNWWRPGIEQFVGSSPSRVYAKDYTGNLVVMDIKDGGMIGAANFLDYKKYLINDQSDRLYLATESGLIVCLREPAREFPIFFKNPERLPLMPVLAPEGAQADASAPPAAGTKEASPPAAGE